MSPAAAAHAQSGADFERLTPYSRDLRKKQHVTTQSLEKIEDGRSVLLGMPSSITHISAHVQLHMLLLFAHPSSTSRQRSWMTLWHRPCCMLRTKAISEKSQDEGEQEMMTMPTWMKIDCCTHVVAHGYV